MLTPSLVERVMEAWGATAEPLPTTKKEGADWLAVLHGCRLLVEEKTKLDDQASVAARQSAFQSKNVYATSTPLVHKNRLSGIVRKAASQLHSTSSDLAHDLRIVWLTGIGRDAEAKAEVAAQIRTG